MPGNGHVRFGGRPRGKGPIHNRWAPRRAAHPARTVREQFLVGITGEITGDTAEETGGDTGGAMSGGRHVVADLLELRLGIPPTLARTLRSTNAIESMISICRAHSANVKRWRDGQMALRWCAAGMVEAGKQFRRVNGHLHLRSLRDTLDKVTDTVGATVHDEAITAA